VVDEALRLYPPGASTMREARGAIELGGYAIPDGATVVVATYSIQRDPAYWPKADAFLPERWIKVRARARLDVGVCACVCDHRTHVSSGAVPGIQQACLSNVIYCRVLASCHSRQEHAAGHFHTPPPTPPPFPHTPLSPSHTTQGPRGPGGYQPQRVPALR
jgi:hypothetical protein